MRVVATVGGTGFSRLARPRSGQSGDGLIDHGESVGTVLEVDPLPLVVHVVHVVDLAVDDWFHHVDEKEDWDGGEDKSHPVTRQTDVDLPVSLERAEGLPQAPVVRRGSERRLLLAKAWDVKVDTSAQLGLDLVALDHLHDLPLLLIGLRVVRADLSQVLVDVVLHIFLSISLLSLSFFSTIY